MSKKSVKASLSTASPDEGEHVALEIARRQITNLIADEAGAMVVEAIKKAKKGQYQVMKYLFQLAGVFPAIAQQAAQDDDLSLARDLCNPLGLREPKGGELSGTGGGESRTNGHALK
jgi:hypothetical protein